MFSLESRCYFQLFYKSDKLHFLENSVFAQLKIFEVGALSATFMVPLYLTFKRQRSNCVFALTTEKFRKAFYVVIGVRH